MFYKAFLTDLYRLQSSQVQVFFSIFLKENLQNCSTLYYICSVNCSFTVETVSLPHSLLNLSIYPGETNFFVSRPLCSNRALCLSKTSRNIVFQHIHLALTSFSRLIIPRVFLSNPEGHFQYHFFEVSNFCLFHCVGFLDLVNFSY